VAGQHGVGDEGDHGVVVAEHAREELLSGAELADEVPSHLLLDRGAAPHDSAVSQFA
jgi:hypothetical protein